LPNSFGLARTRRFLDTRERRDKAGLSDLSDLRQFKGTVMGGQRQSSSIRQQREMSRKLKAAEKRAKRQNRTTDKLDRGTERAKDH
jgi:hypothetical protein